MTETVPFLKESALNIANEDIGGRGAIGGMMRLLLVEDELEIQSFIKQSLTGAGSEVHTAEDGNTAALLSAKQSSVFTEAA